MDESVVRGMAKWPNVPAVFGWMTLDMRGRWLLKGRAVDHPQSVAFINNNYGCDEQGRWFFQNGPQRVFLELAYTPWIYRLDSTHVLFTHTGLAATRPKSVWLDEDGLVLLVTEHGPGLLRDQDLPLILEHFTNASGEALDVDAMEEALTNELPENTLFFSLQGEIIPISSIQRAEAPSKLGYQKHPRPDSQTK